MENKVFYNGVNLVRDILENACREIDLGLVGQKMVMEQLVDPMVAFLNSEASILSVDGEMIDVLDDKLDEDFEIPPEIAALAIERIRTVRRLIHECVEVPKYAAAHIGNMMVVAVKSLEEVQEIMERKLRPESCRAMRNFCSLTRWLASTTSGVRKSWVRCICRSTTYSRWVRSPAISA